MRAESVGCPGDALEDAGLAAVAELQNHDPLPSSPSPIPPDGHHARYRHAPRAYARHVPPAAPAVLKGASRDEQEPESPAAAGEDLAALLNDKFFKLGYDESSTSRPWSSPG